jgi:hypothetical protein
LHFIPPSSRVPQIRDDPCHVCNTLPVTYHTYLFISSIIYGYICSFFFTYFKSCSGGGDGTFPKYCPRAIGFCSCRSATIGKPTQHDANRLLMAFKSGNRSARPSFASINLLKHEVNLIFKNSVYNFTENTLCLD